MASRQSKASAQRSALSPEERRSPHSDPTAPTRHLEVETKLEIGPSVELPNLSGRRSLKDLGVAAAAEPLVFDLNAVYFDTTDLDLLASKLTLRYRTGGEDAGWHLKLPAVADARTEVGLPPENSDFDALTARVPAVLSDLVLGAARGKDLRPVARIRNRRTVRRYLDPDGTALVEVADDQVTATHLSPTPDGWLESGTNSWRELEVELLAGDRQHLAAVVRLLIGAGATPASSASKLGRALQSTGRAVVRSKGAGAPVISALARLRDSLISTDRVLREGTDRALYDARATARRIRSVLGVHAPLFTQGSVRHLRGELRYFGSVLSGARDLEVLRRRLGGQLDDEPTDYATVARARIDLEFGAVHPAALAEVAELIASQRYLEMLLAFDAFLATPPFSRRAGRSAVPELSNQLAAAWKELGSLVEKALADPLDDTAFHEVRKTVKALRYAAEADSPVLGDDVVVFAAALEEVQEVLGEHQDAATSATWLAELALRPDTDGISGFVFGRLHAFEQAAAAGSADDFSDAWARLVDRDLATVAFDR